MKTLHAPARLLLVSMAAVAAAAEPLQVRGVLRVATPGDYAPYALRQGPDGPYIGADIALARELAVELGLGLQIVPTTWGSLVADAKAGNFDIALGGVSVTSERQREAHFSQSYSRDHKSPLTRCGEQERYDSQKEIDQPSVRLIVNAGGTNERLAHERFPHATLTVLADNRAVFNEIAAGRADVMVTDAVEARLQSSQDSRLCVAESAPDWEPRDKAVLVAGGTELVASINAGLAQVLRRQPYELRLNAWLTRDWHKVSDPTEDLAGLADQRLAVMIEIARWKWNRKAAIEDLPRERVLLAAMDSGARARGIDPVRVTAFFSAQIEAAKQLQRELFARWEREDRGAFAGVSDLDTVLRPQVDALNQRILVALGKPESAPASGRIPGPLTLSVLSPESARLALAPLAR